MTRGIHYRHEFVAELPEEIDPDVLYVSMSYATATHLCFCGCRSEIVTPISPQDWKLAFDGESVSLSPSIGNWSYPCRSHYFLRCGRVDWAATWSDAKVAANRTDARSTRVVIPEGRHGERRGLLGLFWDWVRRR